MHVKRLFGPLICLLAMLVEGCTITPDPTPHKYDRAIGYNILQGERSCELIMPPGVKAKEFHFYPNAGGDQVTLDGAARFVLFDSASPTTAEEHDSNVLLRAHPSGYDFRQIGPDLLICGKAYWQELLVIRHFCFDSSAEPPWNNQFEEITFPQARETWLADDLYDALGSDKKFPDVKRVNKGLSDQENACRVCRRAMARPPVPGRPPTGMVHRDSMRRRPKNGFD